MRPRLEGLPTSSSVIQRSIALRDQPERDILERAVRSIAEQAARANEVVEMAIEAGLAPITRSRLRPGCSRQELLSVKVELERELGS